MKTKLSNSEWKIMNMLWKHAPMTIMELTKELYDDTKWSKHAVMTYLKRMEVKGAVHFEQGKKAKLYYPDIEKNDTIIQETREFLDRVFDGKLSIMLSTMVEKKGISDEDIEELCQILKDENK